MDGIGRTIVIHRGGCLCGAIRYEAEGPAANPHTCSCSQCSRHTGAPTAAWVEFAAGRVRWIGRDGAPAAWRSSDVSSRAFCRTCGSSIGAIDDAPTIALLVGTLDDKDCADLVPTSHSFADDVPHWWHLPDGPT